MTYDYNPDAEVPCPACNGSGYEEDFTGHHYEPCCLCNGRGHVPTLVAADYERNESKGRPARTSRSRRKR